MRRYLSFGCVLLFLLAFSFTLALAIDGPPINPPPEWHCCYVPPGGGCTSQYGVWDKYQRKCRCDPGVPNPNDCPLICKVCF